MSSFILWFLSFQIIQHSFSFSLARGGSEIDKLSLLAFKAQISDPLKKLSSWNESLHFCQWSGVTCGGRDERVIQLDLHSSQLVGSLSPSIGNLSFLRLLSLENNSFTNTTPQEVGRLEFGYRHWSLGTTRSVVKSRLTFLYLVSGLLFLLAMISLANQRYGVGSILAITVRFASGFVLNA
jgi:hypothetical protein